MTNQEIEKEIIEFLRENNWLGLEDEKNAKGVVKIYMNIYKSDLKIKLNEGR